VPFLEERVLEFLQLLFFIFLDGDCWDLSRLVVHEGLIMVIVKLIRLKGYWGSGMKRSSVRGGGRGEDLRHFSF